MTPEEAHAIVQKEVAKRVRRKQRGKWGSENKKVLRADRAYLSYLHSHPGLHCSVMMLWEYRSRKARFQGEWI